MMASQQEKIDNIDKNIVSVGNDLNKLISRTENLESTVQSILENQKSIIDNQRIIIEEIKKLNKI